MAAPPCMGEDGRQAVFVGTMLQTGDAVALCDECLVMWASALLQAMTGIDPEPFLRAVSEVSDGQEAERNTPAAEATDTVPDVSHGMPSDEPPPPAPHDTDDGERWSAEHATAEEAAAAGDQLAADLIAADQPDPPNGRGSRGSRGRGTAAVRGDQPGNGEGAYAPTDIRP